MRAELTIFILQAWNFLSKYNTTNLHVFGTIFFFSLGNYNDLIKSINPIKVNRTYVQFVPKFIEL